MNRNNNIPALAIGLLGFIQIGFGQTTPSPDTLSRETVIITNDFEPVIKNAKKINSQPVIEKVEKTVPKFTYDLVTQNEQYTFVPDTINPVKIKGEPLNQLYRAYLKAGMGNYLNSLGELHINSLRSRDFQWRLDAHHLASNGGIEDLPYNGFSTQNVDLYAKKLLKHHVVDAGFIFDRQRVYQYGVNPAFALPVDSINEDDIKQTYMMYQGHASIESYIADSNEMNYKIGFNYYNLSEERSGASENNFKLNSKFSKFFGTEKGTLYFDVDYNKHAFTNEILAADVKRDNLLVKPAIDVSFTGKKWHLLAGFKMAFENSDASRFYFYPNVEFKYNVVKNLIVPYLGVTGGMKRNSLNSFRMENPFIQANLLLANSSTAYDAYLGVRGVYSSRISYNVSAGYKQVKSMPLFVSDQFSPIWVTNAENQYRTIYDTVNVAHVSAQVSYEKSDKWNVLFRLNYNNYETQNEVNAWNLPDFTSDVTVRYTLQEKIIAKSSITFMGSRYTKMGNAAGGEELALYVYGRKLDPIVDFNLGIEYRFTKKISAFVDANNILAQNYEIWGNYRVQGFNVLGGVTIAFWAK